MPLLDDDQNFDAKLRDPNALPLLKLHGCITQTRNPACPLVLSADSYIDYDTKRSRLFHWFRELASDRTVVFLGYSLTDPNITAILERLTQRLPNRLRYYLLTKNITPIEVRYWEKKKIQAIDSTFDDVMNEVDQRCKGLLRGMIRPPNSTLDAVREKLVRPDVALSDMTAQFLGQDVDYLATLKPSEVIAPEQFYKGVSFEWSPIEQNLDVRRKLVDRMLEDYFIDTPDEKGSSLIVVKAHAGAGKTVLLQRLAWDAAKLLGRFCLVLRPEGVLNAAALKELAEAVQEPVFLFVNDLVEHRREIEELFRAAEVTDGQIVVIGAARTNEWNQSPESLTSLAADVDIIDLPYLHPSEIDELLKLLERHHALGSLEQLSPEQRKERLDFQAGRQLLVALHEATHGRTFIDIIADEYDGITPRKAQEIYLTVCLLNQFGAKVRAGIISRMHGVEFEEFRQHFFKPLEQVVIVRTDRLRDHTYEARHPLIAEFVVRSKLTNQEDLYREVIACLQHLNPAFSTDRAAFNAMVRGHSVQEHFPDHAMASALYEVAREQVGDDPYLLQQMTIYEMNRPNGNLVTAETYIRKALQMKEHSRQFKHTLAELHFRRATASRQPVERRKWIDEARTVCQELIRAKSDEPYAHYTLIKIGTLELDCALKEEVPDDKFIDEIARRTEQAITDGLQRFPNNAEMRQAEARYAGVTIDNDRFVKALRRAFDLNPRNAMTAIRLSEIYEQQNDLPEALAILKRGLDARPGESQLRFRCGRLLIKMKGDNDEILYQLARGYTPGDDNYEAQFWHARQLFVADRRQESKALFRQLARARVAPEDRYRDREPLDGTFRGRVDRVHATYFLIARDGDGEWILASRERVPAALWQNISIGQRLKFRIAFCLSGTVAIDVEPI